MSSLIISYLEPFLKRFGFEREDIIPSLQRCAIFFLIIALAFAMMIAAMIFAHRLKRGVRGFFRTSVFAAFLAAVLLVVNLACFGPLRGILSDHFNKTKAIIQEETAEASREVIQELGEEGIVLVQNDGLLPLALTDSINVFGWSSISPVFGGADAPDDPDSVGILQSLQDAGFDTNPDLEKFYEDYQYERPVSRKGSVDWTLPEPPAEDYTEELMNGAEEFSGTAMIVISRPDQGGADLPTDMNAVIRGTKGQKSEDPDTDGESRGQDSSGKAKVSKGTSAVYYNNGPYDDFEPGEHYLELSVTEERMIRKVCSRFNRVIILVNSNNPMEMGWVGDFPEISAVLLVPAAGSTGFSALGKILSGEVNPSARTADTYVRDLTKVPFWNYTGSYPYSNSDEIMEAFQAEAGSEKGSLSFTNFPEGIYVGYRFYETAEAEKLIDFHREVMYPFGYGLSYTTFTRQLRNFVFDGENLSFDVEVINTGDTAGKDVEEIYLTPPYRNGGIEKAETVLIGFAKTSLLEPGMEEILSFKIPADELASYDTGIGRRDGGYVLEAGKYVLSLRSDSHTVIEKKAFRLEKDLEFGAGRAGDRIPAVNRFQDYSRGELEQLSRKDGFENYTLASQAPEGRKLAMSESLLDSLAEINKGAGAGNLSASDSGHGAGMGVADVPFYGTSGSGGGSSAQMPVMGARNNLTLADLSGKSYDDDRWDLLLDQLSFDDMSSILCPKGLKAYAVDSIGRAGTSDSGGPAGIMNESISARGTAFPSEILIAQTWNEKLAGRAGEAMAREFADAKSFGWHGPVLNIHRCAFSGAWFNSFSEDTLLTGRMALAEINGAAKNHVCPYLGLLTLNDLDAGSSPSLLNWASEQAIREIYLRPFEIAVKGFQGVSIGVTASACRIGPVPCSANAQLLDGVLRGEWGFTGVVAADGLSNGDAYTQKADKSAETVTAMRQACKNLLYTEANSGYYCNGAPAPAEDRMASLFQKADIAAGLILALFVGFNYVLFMIILKKLGNYLDRMRAERDWT